MIFSKMNKIELLKDKVVMKTNVTHEICNNVKIHTTREIKEINEFSNFTDVFDKFKYKELLDYEYYNDIMYRNERVHGTTYCHQSKMPFYAIHGLFNLMFTRDIEVYKSSYIDVVKQITYELYKKYIRTIKEEIECHTVRLLNLEHEIKNFLDMIISFNKYSVSKIDIKTLLFVIIPRGLYGNIESSELIDDLGYFFQYQAVETYGAFLLLFVKYFTSYIEEHYKKFFNKNFKNFKKEYIENNNLHYDISSHEYIILSTFFDLAEFEQIVCKFTGFNLKPFEDPFKIVIERIEHTDPSDLYSLRDKKQYLIAKAFKDNSHISTPSKESLDKSMLELKTILIEEANEKINEGADYGNNKND